MYLRSRFCFELFLWLFCARAQANVADAEVNIDTTIEEHMRKDADLSQFYSLLQREVVANNTLQHEAVTIFAPINEAFQKLGLGKEDDPRLVRYHLINVPRTSNNLGDLKKPIALPSELPGHPPLWITIRQDRYHNDIYVNNARMVLNQSNVKGRNKGMVQVLHKIDEVLMPVMSLPSASNPLYNPSAWEFLSQFEILDIHPYRLRSFRQRVEHEHKKTIFENDGGHTFFIPVDEGFKNSRLESIDSKVIDGHVIPGEVLFTSATPREIPYKSAAFEDNLKVVLTFSEETNGKSKTVYIKSNTLMGDNRHPTGVVFAEIVRANIPVQNGVVHLIHKPLMIVDFTVKQFIEDKEDGILSKFYWAIQDLGDAGQEFLRTIERSNEVTLFAPNNAAWDDANLKNVMQDRQRMKEILDTHLVPGQSLSVDSIISRNRKQLFRVPTLAKRRNLYFNVLTTKTERILTVEGGGVNATVVQENFAATNGIIHIIDRVLGVPYVTILEKLRTDPLLNDTFFLGSRQGFNSQLNKTDRKFTYFIPRNKAWSDAKISLPSVIKKLFMPQFTYHATQLLERHLVVSDIPYTMERIKLLSGSGGSRGVKDNTVIYNEVELPSQGGPLRIAVEESGNYTFRIHWKGEIIEVFRPNIECTNGVIHVIDKPFLREGDIRVSGATNVKMSSLLPHIVMVFVAKWLFL